MKKKAGQAPESYRSSESVRASDKKLAELAVVEEDKEVEPVMSDNDFYKSLSSTKSSKKSSDSKKSKSSSKSSKSSSSKSAKNGGKKKKKNKAVPIIISVVAALILLTGGAFLYLYYTGFFKPSIEVTMADGTPLEIKVEAAYAELMTDKFFPGIKIDGIDVGGMTKQEAFDVVTANQPEEPMTIDVKLKLLGKTLNLDFSNAEFDYNTSDVIDEAFAQCRPATVENPEDIDPVALTDCYNKVQQLRNTPLEYETAYTIQIDGVTEKVEKVLGFYVEDYAVVQDAAIVDFDTKTKTFTTTPEKTGYIIDVDATANAVKGLFDSKVYTGVIEVPTEIQEPQLTEEMIQEQFGLVGECSTKCSNNYNRNCNISQACKNMNGKMLQPGETFSFNKVVGQRTSANGFKEATVILGGQYEQGLGGGICQASTTLYNAVLKSNLKVVERSAHAWPSDYVPTGLDATVDWPNLDFKFTNDSEFQVIIVTWFDWDKRTVNAQIYGKKLPDGQSITLEAKVVSVNGTGPTEYVEDKELATGKRKTIRQAHTGQTAKAYKVWKDKDGKEIKREEYNTTTYTAYGERIAIGTKNPDGTYAKFDKKTGEYTSAVPASPTPTPAQSGATPTPAGGGGGGGGGSADPTTPPKPTDPPPPTTPPEPPEGGEGGGGNSGEGGGEGGGE